MNKASKAVRWSQRVIVSGMLDASPGNDREFILRLASGESLRLHYPPGDRRAYASLVGARVVVDGAARFRTSGAVSVVIANFIQPATPADVVWERAPRPRPRSLEDLKPRTPVPPGTNRMERVFGHWPGDAGLFESRGARYTFPETVIDGAG